MTAREKIEERLKQVQDDRTRWPGYNPYIEGLIVSLEFAINAIDEDE